MYGALPYSGGLLDQDGDLLWLMEWCQHIRHLHGLGSVEITQLDGETFKLLDRIKRAARGDK